MKIIKHIDLPVIEFQDSVHPTRQRLAAFKYEDLMPLLVENYEKPANAPDRVAFFDMLDHVVTIRSLKLRTFIHNHIKGDCSCTGVGCNIKPTHFTLEKDINNRRGRDQTAYLSLYGINEHGQEVEFTHDHTLARCFGGANSLINTTVMCQPCNNLKSRIESRMHNKTLSVLKQFLEETTGQPADPHFVLERLRSNQYNQALPEESELVYERADVLSLDVGLSLIRSKHESVEWAGKRIRTDGVRLNAFAHHNEPHCQDPGCQIKATHFAVERVQGKQKDDHQGFFLNMYALKGGEEVSFHHHHVINPGKDGVPESLSIAILCRDCKTNNLTQELHQVSTTLLDSYQGVTKEQADELSIVPSAPKTYPASAAPPRPQGPSKKTTNILAALSVMAKHYKMSEGDFLQWCNVRGLELGLSNKIKNNPTIKKMVKNFPLTIPGARYFRQLQRALFNPLSDDLCAKTEDIVKAKQQDALREAYVEQKKDHANSSKNPTPPFVSVDTLAFKEVSPVASLSGSKVSQKIHSSRPITPHPASPVSQFASGLSVLQEKFNCSVEELWQMSRVQWHQTNNKKALSNSTIRQKQKQIGQISTHWKVPSPMVVVLLSHMAEEMQHGVFKGFGSFKGGEPRESWQETWARWSESGQLQSNMSTSHFTAQTRLPLSMTLNNRMDNVVRMCLEALSAKNHLTPSEYLQECSSNPLPLSIDCPSHMGYALQCHIPDPAQGRFLSDCAQFLHWGPLHPVQLTPPDFFEQCDQYLKGRPIALRLDGETFAPAQALEDSVSATPTVLRSQGR